MSLVNTLQERWVELWRQRNIQPASVEPLWQELVLAYSGKNRHYHNLQHLAELFRWQDNYVSQLNHPHIVALAIWYHDVVYNIIGADKNELRSAQLAVQRLQALNLSPQELQYLHNWIVATKTHQLSDSSAALDAHFFLDFDLAILGSTPEVYQNYAQQIRREYHIYPDFLYRRGRRKVLQHLLDQPHLFSTKAMRDRLEKQARSNLQQELESL